MESVIAAILFIEEGKSLYQFVLNKAKTMFSIFIGKVIIPSVWFELRFFIYTPDCFICTSRPELELDTKIDNFSAIESNLHPSEPKCHTYTVSRTHTWKIILKYRITIYIREIKINFLRSYINMTKKFLYNCISISSKNNRVTLFFNISD